VPGDKIGPDGVKHKLTSFGIVPRVRLRSLACNASSALSVSASFSFYTILDLKRCFPCYLGSKLGHSRQHRLPSPVKLRVLEKNYMNAILR
jgi:hypothetical protein